MIKLIGQRTVGQARRSPGPDHGAGLVSAVGDAGLRVDADGVRTSGRVVDVPGRVLLILVDDLDDACGTHASVDRVGDELGAGRVVDRNRPGAAVDGDAAQAELLAGCRRAGDAGRRGAEDLAVQVDVAGRALDDVVQDDLVGQCVILRLDLHVAATGRGDVGSEVDVVAACRRLLILGQRLRIPEDARDVVLGALADRDGVIVALPAGDRAVDVEVRRREDDRLARIDGRGSGIGHARRGLAQRLQVDDGEEAGASRAVERPRAVVRRVGLAAILAVAPGRVADRRLAGVVVRIPDWQEDRRVELAAVRGIIQIEQARGEHRAGARTVVGDGVIDGRALAIIG